MIRYRRGQVVVLPFPFADAPDEKLRPAVVVSSGGYMSQGIDLIVAMVSTNIRLMPRLGDHRLADWRRAGLNRPSIVRARLATVDSRRVTSTIGSLSSRDLAAYDKGLRAALGLP